MLRYLTPFLLAACAGAADPTDADTDADTDATPTTVEVTETSFGCITDMEPVRRYYATNLLGDVAATLAVAEDPEGKRFPVGTLIQLVPLEAMVKREAGFAPETDDWEFFFLSNTASGTEIVSRGADATNAFGGNCADCHEATADTRDWTCEDGHGCVDLPLTSEAIVAIQEADPRCGG